MSYLQAFRKLCCCLPIGDDRPETPPLLSATSPPATPQSHRPIHVTHDVLDVQDDGGQSTTYGTIGYCDAPRMIYHQQAEATPSDNTRSKKSNVPIVTTTTVTATVTEVSGSGLDTAAGFITDIVPEPLVNAHGAVAAAYDGSVWGLTADEVTTINDPEESFDCPERAVRAATFQKYQKATSNSIRKKYYGQVLGAYRVEVPEQVMDEAMVNNLSNENMSTETPYQEVLRIANSTPNASIGRGCPSVIPEDTVDSGSSSANAGLNSTASGSGPEYHSVNASIVANPSHPMPHFIRRLESPTPKVNQLTGTDIGSDCMSNVLLGPLMAANDANEIQQRVQSFNEHAPMLSSQFSSSTAQGLTIERGSATEIDVGRSQTHHVHGDPSESANLDKTLPPLPEAVTDEEGSSAGDGSDEPVLLCAGVHEPLEGEDVSLRTTPNLRNVIVETVANEVNNLNSAEANEDESNINDTTVEDMEGSPDLELTRVGGNSEASQSDSQVATTAAAGGSGSDDGQTLTGSVDDMFTMDELHAYNAANVAVEAPTNNGFWRAIVDSVFGFFRCGSASLETPYEIDSRAQDITAGLNCLRQKSEAAGKFVAGMAYKPVETTTAAFVKIKTAAKKMVADFKESRRRKAAEKKHKKEMAAMAARLQTIEEGCREARRLRALNRDRIQLGLPILEPGEW